ncbi:hypothetical protein B0I35DRAFT_278828 [Stachybotrys elegans]|uniref:Uncharacterized protein n=1 Tax=Stachybotrys elegans TaxID=80388 RepID=A0A8K0SS94_9HYPO|nr:hypothetical protein B0I35DRAFT_278828 [Stachybotrys elegans]
MRWKGLSLALFPGGTKSPPPNLPYFSPLHFYYPPRHLDFLLFCQTNRCVFALILTLPPLSLLVAITVALLWLSFVACLVLGLEGTSRPAALRAQRQRILPLHCASHVFLVLRERFHGIRQPAPASRPLRLCDTIAAAIRTCSPYASTATIEADASALARETPGGSMYRAHGRVPLHSQSYTTKPNAVGHNATQPSAFHRITSNRAPSRAIPLAVASPPCPRSGCIRCR